MNPRDRWLAVLGRRSPDRIPIDDWGTEETTGKLLKALDCTTTDALWNKLGIDRVHWAFPVLNDPHAFERNGADVWGIRTKKVEYAGGAGSYDEVIDPPLAGMETVSELEKYRWPDPDWWDDSTVAEQCRQQAGWPIQGGYFSSFYHYSNMRGTELAMEDLIASPEFVEAGLQRIFEIHYALFEKTLKAGGGAIDLVEVTEDLGTQDAPMFSMPVFRGLFKERMRKMAALAHKYGAKVMTHSDGAIRAYIPDLIELGSDILNPIQWRCPGMEREGLKRDFGRDIVFHGGVDNQQTLPFGTAEDVRREVRDNIRILGEGGGYIIAPCHNIQPITPVENILAMYEEAHKVAGF